MNVHTVYLIYDICALDICYDSEFREIGWVQAWSSRWGLSSTCPPASDGGGEGGGAGSWRFAHVVACLSASPHAPVCCRLPRSSPHAPVGRRGGLEKRGERGCVRAQVLSESIYIFASKRVRLCVCE